MLCAGLLATNEAPLHRQIVIDGFTASDKTAAPMFPFYENPSDWDEYGEVINPDDYAVNETELMDYQSSQPVCLQPLLQCPFIHCSIKLIGFNGGDFVEHKLLPS